jgi:two-component system sensor histidine kinase BaeS
MSSMILKPVDRLVDASRRLAREEFDHRIAMDRRDEFGELAAAYNSLAAHLQANEQRRMDVLQQVARTLNHELNNALAIIQLQLDRVSRSRVIGSDAMAQAQPLHEMQEALTRMADTVAALGKVRRIVLTDYASGMKMLDLQASVAE